MKIAVTYDNGTIFQHFGKTESFKLYNVEDGAVVSSEVVGTNGSGHEALAGFLKNYQVDVLICGGIGMGAQDALTDAGIEICTGAQGDADQAVEDAETARKAAEENVTAKEAALKEAQDKQTEAEQAVKDAEAALAKAQADYDATADACKELADAKEETKRCEEALAKADQEYAEAKANLDAVKSALAKAQEDEAKAQASADHAAELLGCHPVRGT